MPRGNQLARQWQLLQMIQHPAGIAVDDAAHKLDCTDRTIWPDEGVLDDADRGESAAGSPSSGENKERSAYGVR